MLFVSPDNANAFEHDRMMRETCCGIAVTCTMSEDYPMIVLDMIHLSGVNVMYFTLEYYTLSIHNYF